MYPYWYERQMKIERQIMLLGMILLGLSWIYGSVLALIGWIMVLSGPVFQHARFNQLKFFRESPLRCECGGHFVTPWEIGFDAPADHLICDNEHGNGRGTPCENWIVTPPDYHSLETTVIKNE